jgi:hypothetical protein
MAHAQKPDSFFRRNGRVHLNLRGLQFGRLLAAEVRASAVVMLDTPCSEVVWRVLATHSIRQFPLHFPSRASPCGITFQLDSISCAVGIGCMFCIIDWATYSRHNSYTFASQPWAFCKSSPRRKSCASVRFQIWWPGRMCVCFTAEWVYQISVAVECYIILSSRLVYLRSNNIWRPNSINNSFKTPRVICIRDNLAEAWLRLLVAEGPPRRAELHSRPVSVGSVVGKVAIGHDFIQILRFCPVSVIPPMLHTRISPKLTVCNFNNDSFLQNTRLCCPNFSSNSDV